MDTNPDEVPALVTELVDQWAVLARELAREAEMLDAITITLPALAEECGPVIARAKPAAADLARRLAVYVSALQRFERALPPDSASG